MTQWIVTFGVFLLDWTQLNLTDVADRRGYKTFYKLLQVITKGLLLGKMNRDKFWSFIPSNRFIWNEQPSLPTFILNILSKRWTDLWSSVLTSLFDLGVRRQVFTVNRWFRCETLRCQLSISEKHTFISEDFTVCGADQSLYPLTFAFHKQKLHK